MPKIKSVRYTGYAAFADGNQLKRVQTLSSTTDFTEEKLLELANKGVTEVVDQAAVSATLESNDYGDTATFAAVLGQGIFNSTRTNDYVIDDNSFDNAVCDLSAKVSSNDAALERSVWIGGAYLTSIALSYSVDGVATETYDFEGEHKRWFLNTYKNINVYKADFSDASTILVSGTDISAETPILVTQDTLVIADVNAGDAITDNFTGGNTEYTTDTGTTFADGERFRVVTYAAGTQFPTLQSTPSGLGGLRKGMVDIYLWDTSAGSEEKSLRVQSVDIAIDLSREEKVELGTDKAYFRQLTRPIDVSVSMDLTDSDLEVYAKLSGNEAAYDADTLNTISADDFNKTNRLLIKLYKDENSHVIGNLMKFIQINDMSVASEEESISVGEDGTVSLTMTADNFLISGSGVNPIL
jgi:hypothetical protein